MYQRCLRAFFVLVLASALPILAQHTVTRRIDASNGVILSEIASIAAPAEEGEGVTLNVLPTDLRPKENRGLDIQEGDRILMMNGRRIRSADALRELYEGVEEGGEVKLALERGDERFFVSFEKGDGSNTLMSGGGGGVEQRVMIAGPGAGKSEFLHEAFCLLGEEDGHVKVINQIREVGDLRPGDVIEKVNGKAVGSIEEYRSIYEAAAIGDELRFLVGRGGESVEVVMEKSEPPAGMMIRRQG